MMRLLISVLVLAALVALFVPAVACSDPPQEEVPAARLAGAGAERVEPLPLLTVEDVEATLGAQAEGATAARRVDEVDGRAEDAVAREPGPVRPTAPAGGPTELSEWRMTYLAEAARQARGLERAIGGLGESRLGSAALAASALAANGREDWRPQAATWVERALERCSGRWHKLECELGMLSLQRVVLQFPQALPEELLGRLRGAASQVGPPPGPAQIGDPWSFRRTENQMMAVMGRSLVGHQIGGTAGTPAGRAWTDFARAFLRAHDRQGWYEAESDGYMGTSIKALLLIHDHAPDPEVRGLAGRQLQLLFVAWAENQVDGTPGGPRTRTYTHWAQGVRNTPWRAWAHYATRGAVGWDKTLGDWPDVATAGYEFPAPVVELLKSARDGRPYEVRTRRTIDMGHRRDLDAATYSWVTPDYVLGTAPAVGGLALGVSGGQEIQVTLFADTPDFSPLYLWSRVNRDRSRGNRWRSRSGQEQGAGWRHLAVAWMGDENEAGHAWLAAPWGPLEPVTAAGADGGGEDEAGGGGGAADGEGGDARFAGATDADVLVARSGDTWVALVTRGGWQVSRGAVAFPEQYGGAGFRGTWVAVPRVQPAAIGLQVGRAGEEGSWQAWKEKAAGLSLEVVEAEAGEAGGGRDGPRARPAAGRPTVVFHAAAAGVAEAPGEAPREWLGHRLELVPGEAAAIDGEPIDPAGWPVHRSPHLVRGDDGAWGFRAAGVAYRFPPLAGDGVGPAPAAPAPSSPGPASSPAPEPRSGAGDPAAAPGDG